MIFIQQIHSKNQKIEEEWQLTTKLWIRCMLLTDQIILNKSIYIDNHLVKNQKLQKMLIELHYFVPLVWPRKGRVLQSLKIVKTMERDYETAIFWRKMSHKKLK